MFVPRIREFIPSLTKRLSADYPEWIAGMIVTALIFWLHFLFLRCAGPLWRDEVVSFNVAAQPSLAKLWESYWYDSFPALFHLVLRAWIFLGPGGTDYDVRLLGCVIGLGIVVAFWINGFLLRYRVPVVSLALLGFSPLLVCTTDTLRAYGLGTFAIVLTLGLMWSVVESASPGRVLLATVAGVLSVQSLYQNLFLLFAICLGATVSVLRLGKRKEVAFVLGIGCIAALSTAINFPALMRMRDVSGLMAAGVSSERLFRVFVAALREGGNFMPWIWVALILGCLLGATRPQVTDCASIRDRRCALAVFSTVTIFTAGLAFFFWLKVLGLPTQPWYFVPLLALIAVSLDATFGTLPPSQMWTRARVAFLVVLALSQFFYAVPVVRLRQTDLDVIAAGLEKTASKDDLIVVQPWYCGATFDRYFHGGTEWTTLPPLKDQSLHRLDLFEKQMRSADPMAPVVQRIEQVLRNGHRVWLVGALPFRASAEKPPQIPPIPAGQPARNHDRYGAAWTAQVAYFVQTHGLEINQVTILTVRAVDIREDLPLVVVSGWRPTLGAHLE